MLYNGIHIGVVRIIKTKYMNEEQIRDEARKAANRSQFMSNRVYDHKSYEDGFYEGMNQALRQYGVMQRSEQLCGFFEADTKTSSATKCKCGREKWEHPKAT